jgi:hypothetical protein
MLVRMWEKGKVDFGGSINGTIAMQSNVEVPQKNKNKTTT